MGTPVKSVIAFSGCKGSSARPEVLKPYRLQAVKVCLCKCTGDAKGRHEESITYGANFRVLCKWLQENIPILSHATPVSKPPEAAQIVYNKLKVKDKAQFKPKYAGGRENGAMAHQLHSFPTTRGGSPGGC
jgi:hypothetical protein